MRSHQRHDLAQPVGGVSNLFPSSDNGLGIEEPVLLIPSPPTGCKFAYDSWIALLGSGYIKAEVVCSRIRPNRFVSSADFL